MGFILCAMPGIRSEFLEIAECDAEVIEELLNEDAAGALSRQCSQHRLESRRCRDSRFDVAAVVRQIPASVRFIALIRPAVAGHRLANGANAPLLA